MKPERASSSPGYHMNQTFAGPVETLGGLNSIFFQQGHHHNHCHHNHNYHHIIIIINIINIIIIRDQMNQTLAGLVAILGSRDQWITARWEHLDAKNQECDALLVRFSNWLEGSVGWGRWYQAPDRNIIVFYALAGILMKGALWNESGGIGWDH